MSGVSERLKQVMADMLGVDPGEVGPGFSHESCEAWDSMKQIILVMAVEEHFGLSFPEAAIPALDSYDKLLAAVNGSGVSGGGE